MAENSGKLLRNETMEEQKFLVQRRRSCGFYETFKEFDSNGKAIEFLHNYPADELKYSAWRIVCYAVIVEVSKQY